MNENITITPLAEPEVFLDLLKRDLPRLGLKFNLNIKPLEPVFNRVWHWNIHCPDYVKLKDSYHEAVWMLGQWVRSHKIAPDMWLAVGTSMDYPANFLELRICQAPAIDVPSTPVFNPEGRPLTYLAVPYSHPEAMMREARYQAANLATKVLTERGRVVFSPITHSHPLHLIGLDGDWEFWKRIDTAYLGVCKELVVLQIPGWDKSIGVTAEIGIANACGMPIEYFDLTLPSPLRSILAGCFDYAWNPYNRTWDYRFLDAKKP